MNHHWAKIKQITEPAYVKLMDSVRHPVRAQEQYLLALLNHNKTSAFGREHRFSTIKTIDQYRSSIKIRTYEQFEKAISQIAAGKVNVLYTDPTLAFEQTSGSSRCAKLIPLTSASMASIHNGVSPWLYDLISHHPSIANGKMYWSISPQTRDKQKTRAGLPIGLDTDAAYLGENLASEIAPQIISIDSALHENVIPKWRLLTARQLLVSSNLTMISIWSPTFLLELLRFMESHTDQLIDFVRTGQAAEINHRLPPDPSRADALRDALSNAPINVSRVWPQFQLLSCWTHGSSARFIDPLTHYFQPNQIQGKGLLATEGMMSIPLCEAPDPVLAVNSGFYEFIDRDGNSYLCHDVQTGCEYRLVITMPNGLYRYDTGDYIRVTGFYHQSPMFQFVGRSTLNSDICGEKLTDAYVASTLARVDGFSLLAPSLTPRPHYVLYLDHARYDLSTAEQITASIERALRENPQYDYARQLNQLDTLSYALIKNPTERYIQSELEQGKTLGDIKPPCLRPETNWGEYLCAH